MAECLATFAAQEGLKMTIKLVVQQICLARGFKKELSKLKDSLLNAQAILWDVDKTKAEYESMKTWVEKLEDIVLEADVLLDEVAYEDVRRKVETGKDLMVRNFFSCSKNSLIFRLKMALKITAVAKKLDEHYSAKGSLGFVGTTCNEAEIDLNQILETESLRDEIIGREAEVSDIVNKLLALKSQELLVVLPIVGMGGLGKTALAKEVFHHERIRKNFDTTIWVCVSDPFDINKILRAILETLNANFGGSDTREVILQELQKVLRDKNYFLVLDDVWNEKPVLWSKLKDYLLKINQNVGNVVLVTTRNDEVAKIVETHYIHHLRRLPNDDCWSLFERCAFGSELPVIPVKIRDELLKKFGGIPLIVKMLGGVVKSCKDYDELLSTLEDLTKIALQDKNHILSIIKLSVDRLPSSSLKQCFAYCSNFPQDFCFYKENLVQMWIAQGLIQLPNESNVMMEDIGAKNFEILLSRSLFQDVVKDGRGKIKFCKMHDLVHDVSRIISNYQNLRWDLITDEKSQGDEVLSIRQRIRTIYYSEDVPFDSYDKITNFIYLRVLVIDLWSIGELSDSIIKLKHLRYLDIFKSKIRELPESIVLLYHLQTLKVGELKIKLPTKLRKLVNLRHLKFNFSSLHGKQMPKHLSRLTQLQTLSHFVVGCDEGCKIEELEPLKDLKGKLSLLCLERVKNKNEALAANLKEKKNISDLCFEWSSQREDCNDNDLNVLEGLQPHKNLQALSIRNFGGKLIPNGIFVENLVELYLQRCKRCETLPMLGQLSKLEVLRITSLHSVKSIGDEFYGNYRDSRTLFPKLKKFYILDMEILEQWEEVSTLSNCPTFPHLESLSIQSSTELTNISNIFASPSKRLEVDTVNARLFPSFQGFPKLRSLEIFHCKSLTKLPNWLELCNSLQDLCIGHFADNISPPNLQNLQNLSSLRIDNLQKLPVGFECIHNLKTLDVQGPMESYDWSPFIHANSLAILMLREEGTNCLTHLPRQLEHLTSLIRLHIVNFNGIESLPEWMGNFTSLKTLAMYRCTNLKNLPSKEAMSNLSKLQDLIVIQCNRLDLNEGSCEHAKVSHVRNINIG